MKRKLLRAGFNQMLMKICRFLNEPCAKVIEAAKLRSKEFFHEFLVAKVISSIISQIQKKHKKQFWIGLFWTEKMKLSQSVSLVQFFMIQNSSYRIKMLQFRTIFYSWLSLIVHSLIFPSWTVNGLKDIVWRKLGFLSLKAVLTFSGFIIAFSR